MITAPTNFCYWKPKNVDLLNTTIQKKKKKRSNSNKATIGAKFKEGGNGNYHNNCINMLQAQLVQKMNLRRDLVI